MTSCSVAQASTSSDGDAGDDILNGGAGRDKLYGGAGSDEAVKVKGELRVAIEAIL